MTNNTFSRNDKGYPVLSRKHQSFISRLMRIKTPPWILLCDVGPIPGLDDPDERVPVADGFLSPSAIRDTLAGGSPTPLESAKLQKSSKKIKDPTPHLNYIRHLQRKQPSRTVAERCGSGFQDFLQIPLQPLTDNLESMTYEVFEKDPVKYDLYEQAIRKALRDWVDQGKPASGPNGCVVLAVAGAGRGPLVTRALRASAAEGVDVEMWAVEKNPNAYVLLQRHNYEDWGSRVNVVKSDMRSWRGPWREDTAFLQSPNIEAQLAEASDPASTPPISVPSPGYTPIDILISELLGSFADNELSPECLDGILHLLNPAHGISIPQSYTSYITPIAAPKLHADIATRTSWDLNAAETPAVVWLHSIDFLSVASIPPDPKAPGQGELIAPPPPAILPVWSFHHGPMQSPPPMPISNSHNTRYARLNFRTRDRGMIHGLAGYFESVLYPGVELSTNPLTMDDKSKDMISWFPIFFPLKVCHSTPRCLVTLSSFHF
jgi:protein arginine N-methyltransferase 5